MWETSSFDSEGRCYVTIQDNGMLVVIAGDDPSAPGNVLWSNNQPVRNFNFSVGHMSHALATSHRPLVFGFVTPG